MVACNCTICNSAFIDIQPSATHHGIIRHTAINVYVTGCYGNFICRSAENVHVTAVYNCIDSRCSIEDMQLPVVINFDVFSPGVFQ